MARPSDERYTPERILDVVRAFAGGQIGLDPIAYWGDREARFRETFDALGKVVRLG